MADIYQRLAKFVDELPAGYPSTDSGVELRILRKLFTPEEAQLFMHLSLIPEEPRVIAYRARQPLVVVSQCLQEMEKKGLIFGIHRPGRQPEYLAQQFVVGFWEGQVNRLDAELVEAVDEYLPTFVDMDLWQKAPQLRVIPVGESIPVQTAALPYERAEEIVRSHSQFAVTNCICRQERHLAGQGCDKPMETCMSFGVVADNIVRTGRGRSVSREEMLAILEQADQAGLVLQPGNTQNPNYICACCGCCCAVLRNLNQHPQPGLIASSPFIAVYDPEICSGCGDCVERCQMNALSLPDGTAELNQARCIGCGLCVSTCTTGALTLERKPQEQQAVIPVDGMAANLQLAQARGKMGRKDLVTMLRKSKADRLAASRSSE